MLQMLIRPINYYTLKVAKGLQLFSTFTLCNIVCKPFSPFAKFWIIFFMCRNINNIKTVSLLLEICLHDAE